MFYFKFAISLRNTLWLHARRIRNYRRYTRSSLFYWRNHKKKGKLSWISSRLFSSYTVENRSLLAWRDPGIWLHNWYYFFFLLRSALFLFFFLSFSRHFDFEKDESCSTSKIHQMRNSKPFIDFFLSKMLSFIWDIIPSRALVNILQSAGLDFYMLEDGPRYI